MFLLIFGVKFEAAGRLWAGFRQGTKDELVHQFTDTEISIAVGIRDSMNHCEPWSQHLTNEGIRKLNVALSKNNAGLAKEAIDTSLTATNAPWCIEILKTAVVLACTKCPTILKDSLPASYY